MIFTDFSMPVLNGIDATQQMRDFFSLSQVSREQQPIIIGVTGHVEDKFKQEGIKAGMDEVQSKPFYLKSMKSVLDKYSYFEKCKSHEEALE